MKQDQIPDRLIERMNEFSFWHQERDDLIKAGLKAGMSCNRIGLEMGISNDPVYRIRDEMIGAKR